MITAERMREDIVRLRREGARDISGAGTAEELEEVRRTYLGRRGRLAALFKALTDLPEEERRAAGAALNEARDYLEAEFTRRSEHLRGGLLQAQLERERVDVTLPGRPIPLGRTHILRRTVEEIQDIFVRMGFDVVEGTEVESEEYNFERLNIPPDHPARDMMDTFYIENSAPSGAGADALLLRTHTTVVDARVMRERKPPMRVVTSGRCYRRDTVDATHMPVFHQVDGFMVGEGITFADLKGVLAEFARQTFGPSAQTRFQPSYFPFTEPSAEVAVRYRSGWLELGGCGMFHPRVLEYAGIDPQRYTAFAFGGFGDRPTMVRYGIPDIRLFWENDLRTLRQF